MNKKFTVALSAAIIATSVSAPALSKGKYEKCYGVVKSGKNDCGSNKKGGHSCAGSATADGDKNEWIFLPSGTCKRLVNGSLKPKSK